MMWMENHAVDDPEEIDHMLNVFLPCEEKVLGMDSDERPVAYYIAFLLPFVLHFIVNWIYSEKIILC